MENSDWLYVKEEGSKGLENFVKSINARCPPEPNELIGLLQNGRTFHLWLKETDREESDEANKWEWKEHCVTKLDDFQKKVKENRDNIIPIAFNDQSNIWYLERKEKEAQK